MIRYPMPQPVPALAVRRFAPDDAVQIAALYRADGRDGAWCGEDTVRALFGMGAVWWGGFADGALVLCAACTASTADTPQAAALRGALAPGFGCLPEYFLLPPAVSRRGEALAGALLPLLARQLLSSAAGVNQPQSAGQGPVVLAALPAKAPAPVLAAYFAAGFAAARMRPLVSLRPHYLLIWRGAPGQESKSKISQPESAEDAPQTNIENGFPAQKAENSTRQASTQNRAPERKIESTVPPPKQEPDALRRVYLPLADTLAVSRLMEQGFCATALCRSSADERTLIQLEREWG